MELAQAALLLMLVGKLSGLGELFAAPAITTW